MNEYSTLPRMFRPEPRDRATLLLIKVPDEKPELSQTEYYELLGQRIEWMIHQWLRVETLKRYVPRLRQRFGLRPKSQFVQPIICVRASNMCDAASQPPALEPARG